MTDKNWQYFSHSEMACRCGCGKAAMSDDFMTRLNAHREACGFPLPVTSGYRCPEHNQSVAETGAAGPHTTGCAADIAVSRDKATRVVRLALGLGFMGIGLKQHGPESGRFVHLDTVPTRPAQIIWTY